jgi:hypothetical protein
MSINDSGDTLNLLLETLNDMVWGRIFLQ